jgi:hypothetical protein
MVEIAFLNCRIGDVTLALEMRKPFDLLAEGLPLEKIGTTGRLLNFLSPESRAGKPGCGET